MSKKCTAYELVRQYIFYQLKFLWLLFGLFLIKQVHFDNLDSFQVHKSGVWQKWKMEKNARCTSSCLVRQYIFYHLKFLLLLFGMFWVKQVHFDNFVRFLVHKSGVCQKWKKCTAYEIVRNIFWINLSFFGICFVYFIKILFKKDPLT